MSDSTRWNALPETAIKVVAGSYTPDGKVTNVMHSAKEAVVDGVFLDNGGSRISIPNNSERDGGRNR